MSKHKIVIAIKGGMLTAVYSNDPDTSYILVDCDNIDSGDPFPTEKDVQMINSYGNDFKEMLDTVKSEK